MIHALHQKLNPVERDLFRKRLTVECGRLFKNVFEIPNSGVDCNRLNRLMKALSVGIELPDYGLMYRGRPAWMTNDVLASLQLEADLFQQSSYFNANQQIARVDTDDGDTMCERLACSAPVLEMVRRHAGACEPLHITSFLYYDSPDQFCEPHTDTLLIPITVLVTIRQEWTFLPRSKVVNYWPERPRLDHIPEIGEVSIFYGCYALHGRTAPGTGERVQALLMSFMPVSGNKFFSRNLDYHVHI